MTDGPTSNSGGARSADGHTAVPVTGAPAAGAPAAGTAPGGTAPGVTAQGVDAPRPTHQLPESPPRGLGAPLSAGLNGGPIGAVPARTPVAAPAVAASAAAAPAVAAPRGPRRAKLIVRTVDPWSVFRFSLVFSVTLLIVWLVVAGVLWSLLKGMGVFAPITTLVNSLVQTNHEFTVERLFNFKHIMLWAGGLGVINAILFTALGTLGSFVYNLCSGVVGGIEVTLADRE